MSGKKQGYEPLPEGEYVLSLKNVETKKTKAGTGTMVNAAFEVKKNDDYKNRLIFESFMIQHPSEKAVKVGRERLNKFLKAVGHEGGLEALDMDTTRLNDFTDELFIASVKVKEAETYQDASGQTKQSKAGNKITNFKPRK